MWFWNRYSRKFTHLTRCNWFKSSKSLRCLSYRSIELDRIYLTHLISTLNSLGFSMANRLPTWLQPLRLRSKMRHLNSFHHQVSRSIKGTIRFLAMWCKVNLHTVSRKLLNRISRPHNKRSQRCSSSKRLTTRPYSNHSTRSLSYQLTNCTKIK